MTLPDPTTPRALRIHPWIYLVIGLLAGFVLGRVTGPKVAAVNPVGNCINRDTSLFGTLSKNDCRAQCPTCSWEAR